MSVESKHGDLVIFDVSPKEHQKFSSKVCEILKTKLSDCEVIKFKDGETDINIKSSVRGKDVFVFQSYLPPIGERKYELEQFMDAAGVGGCANRLNVVMPYLFGSRGERRTRARQPVPAGVVAKDLMGQATNVLTVDVHTTTIGTVYNILDIRFENLEFAYVAANILLKRIKDNGDIVIGTVDVGGANRARHLRNIIARVYEVKGEELVLPLAIANKYRPRANLAEVQDVSGDVKDKTVYVVDDIGDTLGSLYNAAKAYKSKGAKKIIALLCHPVLSEGSEQNLKKMFDEGVVSEIFFGNTLPLKPFLKELPQVKIIPLEPFVAEAIRRIHLDISISGLHRYDHIMEAYGGEIKLL